MNFPIGATAVVRAICDQHFDLAHGSDDQRRTLTLMMAQTMAIRFGPRWGVKATSRTAPQSKDSLAYDNMDGTFDAWDWQNGTTRAMQLADGQPPTYPRIGDQHFIDVEPFDHLEPTPAAPAPAPVEPPKRDEQLERLIDVVQRAVGELQLMTTALDATTKAITDLKASGLRVHL